MYTMKLHVSFKSVSHLSDAVLRCAQMIN